MAQSNCHSMPIADGAWHSKSCSWYVGCLRVVFSSLSLSSRKQYLIGREVGYDYAWEIMISYNLHPSCQLFNMLGSGYAPCRDCPLWWRALLLCRAFNFQLAVGTGDGWRLGIYIWRRLNNTQFSPISRILRSTNYKLVDINLVT